MKRFETVLVLIFSAVALCLPLALLTSDAMCAEDDDDSLISLPEDKETPRTASSTDKKKKKTPQVIVYETQLQCISYDLKQKKNREPVPEFRTASGGTYRSELVGPASRILRQFVNGTNNTTWHKEYDRSGRVSFRGLNDYYSSPSRVWSSYFYVENTSSTTVPQMFACEKDIKPIANVFIYYGYVMAPFSGRFRFVGYGDDYLVVRYKNEIALDYGHHSATLGSEFTTAVVDRLSDSGEKEKSKNKNQIERIRPSMTESTYYTKNKLVRCTPSFMTKPLAQGPILEAKKGEVVPIEILIADLGGDFSFALFYERVTVNGDPLYGKPMYQLFRTTYELPPAFAESSYADFDKDGLTWKVLNANGKLFPSHIKITLSDDAEEKSDPQKVTTTTSTTKSATATTTKPAASSSSGTTTTPTTKKTNTTTTPKTTKTSPFGGSNPFVEEKE